MPRLDEIRAAMATHEPATHTPASNRGAAVAMVLREVAGVPEVLFIERARREGDPWSGHMAFPGGRIDPEDAHARAAAARETLEEVGVDLGGAEVLGRLDDMCGRQSAAPEQGLVISAFVYHIVDPGPLRPNWEVAQAFWFPMPALRSAERRVEYAPVNATDSRFPGILVGEPDRHVVWGLTYRFLEVFFEIVGKPLPNRWEGLEARPSTG